MRAHSSTPVFEPGLAHMVLIFKSFIRKLSKCGVHLYSTRKHAACRQRHSHVIAICTAPGTISLDMLSILHSNRAHERMNSSRLSARSSGSEEA